MDLDSQSKKNSTAPRNAVVLVVDQLTASMLGPYGNTLFETTNFNRLAARSLLFDFAFANSPSLSEAYQSFFSFGKNRSDGSRESDVDSDWDCLPSTLASYGVDTVLLTDEESVGEHPQARFDRVISFQHTTAAQSASSAAETQLASFFAQAAAWLTEEMSPGSLCWLHSRGLSGDWDAPYQYRQRLADSDDPDPPTFVKSPELWLNPDDVDPDELLGLQQASAAQVVLLDEFLGVLLDLMEGQPGWESTLFCLVSPRGCALGEHGLAGAGAQLFEESVHVPFLVCPPAAVDPVRPDLAVEDLNEPLSIGDEATADLPTVDSSAATFDQVSELRLASTLRATRSSVLVQPDLVSRIAHDWVSEGLTDVQWLKPNADPSKTDQSNSDTGENAEQVALVEDAGTFDGNEGENPDAFMDRLAKIASVLPDKRTEYVLISSNEQDSLQTHAWKLIRSRMGGVQLYSKPDDRCEVNDVSDRCSDIVRKMTVLMDHLLEEGKPERSRQVKLSDDLAFGIN